MYESQFLQWSQSHRRLGALEARLLEYVAYLMMAGTATSNIENSVSAVLFFSAFSERFLPACKGFCGGFVMCDPTGRGSR